MNRNRWEHLQGVFERAADLPPEQRDSFLERECGSDADLAAEVRQLIAESPPDEFLEPPSAAGAAGFFGGGLQGRTLGDFRLIEEVGRGGVGVVYRARQESLDRQVAVKLLPHSRSGDSETSERFRREARAASRLEHPNINPVFGLGEADGLIWFGMRYVEGHDLCEEIHLQRGTIEGGGAQDLILPGFETPDYVPAMTAQIADLADGIQYAHDRGIIHRDIKPQNILLDSDGRMILVDFGLARNEGSATLTSAGRIAGTLPYMSPEQGQVLRARVDHRTDIYSLSVVLYEALTLERPFQGASAGELLQRIGSGSHTNVRQLNRRVPRDLATVCEKGMARRPQDRYPTAAALAADLRRFLRHEAITARAPSVWARARRWLYRRRLRATAALALMLGLGAASVLARLDARRGKVEGWEQALTRAVSEADWENALPAVVEARQALDEMSASGLGSEEVRKAALQFEARRAADHRERVDEIRTMLDAARTSPSAQEQARHLMAAVAKAGRSALIHDDDPWLTTTSRIESVFPRVSFEVVNASEPVALSYRAIDPVTGIPGEAVSLGFTPLADRPIAPGDYRFSFRSQDGRTAEIERDCRAFGDLVTAQVELRPRNEATRGMVRVRGGTFQLETPRPLGCCLVLDSVFLEDFYLDEAEVSNREYLDYLQATGRTAPTIWRQAGYDGADWRSLPVEAVGDGWLDLPACGLSWEDARDYAEWAGKRLPTHLELEWALRGPELLIRPWGEGTDRKGLRAAVDGPGRRAVLTWRDAYADALAQLSPVRAAGFRHPPNELFHAFGNVQEWTSSKVVESRGGRPLVHELGRYYMGCDWSAMADGDTLDDHAYTNTGDGHASHRVGFRCARSAFD